MKSNFIERSIMGALSFFKESVFADAYAAKNGFLQSLDPRIKTLTFLLFVIQIILTKSVLVLSALYGLCLFLALASRIPLGSFLKRTWVFIPIFSLFIALPSLFAVFSPGEALVVLKIAGLKLVITRQGLSGAALFVMRVLTSVSFVVLLSITTRHFELLKVLRLFGVPQVFVMVLGMCYRYIYLFIETIEKTCLAIKSRVGTRVPAGRGQHLVAWNMAHLWHRSYQLNEEVYRAMLARGYRGEPCLWNDFKVRSRDRLWFMLAAILSLWITLFLS